MATMDKLLEYPIGSPSIYRTVHFSRRSFHMEHRNRKPLPLAREHNTYLCPNLFSLCTHVDILDAILLLRTGYVLSSSWVYSVCVSDIWNNTQVFMARLEIRKKVQSRQNASNFRFSTRPFGSLSLWTRNMHGKWRPVFIASPHIRKQANEPVTEQMKKMLFGGNDIIKNLCRRKKVQFGE